MNGYKEALSELRTLIPATEFNEVMSQDRCELEYDFLGFLNVYKPLSELIPKNHIVIDFGCYLAAQSYLFSEHQQYIGVDVVDMQRFCPPNAVHYISSIQDFIKNEFQNLSVGHKNMDYCAICSYVPDFEAAKLVRNTFQNVFCYYPCGIGV